MEQNKKRNRHRRGKRDETAKTDEPEDACHVVEGSDVPATCVPIPSRNSRGNSPRTDDDRCGSAVSTTSSSAALQLLKERSKSEHARRTNAFARLEAEKELSQRIDIAHEEHRSRDELLHGLRNAAAVHDFIRAQRRVVGSLFLQRQHATEREAVEDNESEGRDDVLDEEVESLGAIIALQYAAVLRARVESPVTVESDVARQGDASKTCSDDKDTENMKDAKTFCERDAQEAAEAFQAMCPTTTVSERTDAPAQYPTRARTAESVCPCTMM